MDYVKSITIILLLNLQQGKGAVHMQLSNQVWATALDIYR
jgi:hypothetical protein